jgi:hypothetical protein
MIIKEGIKELHDQGVTLKVIEKATPNKCMLYLHS